MIRGRAKIHNFSFKCTSAWGKWKIHLEDFHFKILRTVLHVLFLITKEITQINILYLWNVWNFKQSKLKSSETTSDTVMSFLVLELFLSNQSCASCAQGSSFAILNINEWKWVNIGIFNTCFKSDLLPQVQQYCNRHCFHFRNEEKFNYFTWLFSYSYFRCYLQFFS